MARKSKYNREYHLSWIRGLARRGLTVKEISEELGVAKSTICKWVSENEELSDALNEGRDYADTKVEESLYKRAIGYSYTEKKTIVGVGQKGGEQKPARIEITEKFLPADTTACIFWLKNRNPQLWRERQDINFTDDAHINALANLLDEYDNEGPTKSDQ